MSPGTRSWIRTFEPSAKDMNDLLTKTSAVLAQLKNQIAAQGSFPHAQDVQICEEELRKYKEQVSKGDGVDKGLWNAMSPQNRMDVWRHLDTAFRKLRFFNHDRLRVGQKYVGTFLVALLVLGAAYLELHRGPPGQSRIKAQEVANIWETARHVDLNLVKWKDGKAKVEDVTPGLDSLKNLLFGPAREGEARGPLHLPFETSRLIGATAAELALEDSGAQATYQELLKRLKADLESLSTEYFWTEFPLRWLELALWALIGCFVGIVFYIAKGLGEGVFRPEDVPMFWTEVVIAPVVVPVVFFLLSLTDVTEFVPADVTIMVQVGIAFILGFAVRRSIGLLENIKNRLLPSPQASTS